MYGAKQHLLFDAVRHPHGARDQAHGECRFLLNGVDEQVGVDVCAAVDPEVVAELITGPRGELMVTEFRVDRVFPGQFPVSLARKYKEVPRADHTISFHQHDMFPAHEIEEFDRRKHQALRVKAFPVPCLFKVGVGRHPDHSRFPGQHRIVARDWRDLIAGIRQFLELDLVVGELLLIIHYGKDILLAHVPGGDDLLNQFPEMDRVPLGEYPHEVQRLAGTGFLPPAEDPEIVRAGLDHVAPFPQVAVHKKTPHEIPLVGKFGKERIERVPVHLDLLAVEEIERLLRGEPETIRFRPAIPALLVERAPVLSHTDHHAIKYCLHCLIYLFPEGYKGAGAWECDLFAWLTIPQRNPYVSQFFRTMALRGVESNLYSLIVSHKYA